MSSSRRIGALWVLIFFACFDCGDAVQKNVAAVGHESSNIAARANKSKLFAPSSKGWDELEQIKFELGDSSKPLEPSSHAFDDLENMKLVKANRSSMGVEKALRNATQREVEGYVSFAVVWLKTGEPNTMVMISLVVVLVLLAAFVLIGFFVTATRQDRSLGEKGVPRKGITKTAVGQPPPFICQEIVPRETVVMNISLTELISQGHTFITGTLGASLLKVSRSDAVSGTTISIALPRRAATIASITLPHGNSSSALAINSASGIYGFLRDHRPGEYVITYGQRELLNLTTESQGRNFVFFASGTKIQVGSAHRATKTWGPRIETTNQSFKNAMPGLESLDVRIMPGFDPILAMVSLVALIYAAGDASSSPGSRQSSKVPSRQPSFYD